MTWLSAVAKRIPKKEMTMQQTVWVNQDECISCGICVENVPEVFRFADNRKAEVYDPAGASREKIKEGAVDSCPVSCIHLQEQAKGGNEQ
jgi:ferredoxin